MAAGYSAYGVDPSTAKLQAAQSRHGIDAARLGEGALPAAEAPWHARYDAVLCAAALHCVPDVELLDSLYRLRSVVAPGGFLMLTVPASWPSGGEGRDADGRLIHIRPAEQYRFFLERLGMHQIVEYDEADPLGRDEVRSTVMTFGWSGADELRPIEVVESILWDDRKVNTYKFALLRAIAHLATHRPNIARWEGDARVSIPVGPIADLWIRYYWPFMAAGSKAAMTQGHGGAKADVAFRGSLTNLVALWDGSGGHAAFEIALRKGELSEPALKLLKAVRQKIGTAIRQPVRYAGNTRTRRTRHAASEACVHGASGAAWSRVRMDGCSHQTPARRPRHPVVALAVERPLEPRPGRVARQHGEGGAASLPSAG